MEGCGLECEAKTSLYPLCADSSTLGIDHVGHGFLGAQGRWRHRIRLPPSLEDCRTYPNVQYVSAAHELQLGLLHPRRGVLRGHRIWNRVPLHEAWLEDTGSPCGPGQGS